jgi:hypothetical protein
MKLLIIGGTRLLGKFMVEEFITSRNYEITVLSRKASIFKDTCNVIEMEKSTGLKLIQNEWFDLIIDFITYDEHEVKEVTDKIKFGKYIFISSCWMTKLNRKYNIDDFILEINHQEYNSLPIITQEYLYKKRLSENYLNKTFEIGRFHILRLPIFWGENDHTKRLEFYVSRLLDNQPVILINNGNNYCQISNVCELAVNICRFIQEGKLIDQPILEALPSEKESLSGIINIISKAVLSSSELIGFNEVELQKSFSKYLINEPLWREREIQITDNNIFRALNVKTTLPKYWLSKLSIIEAKKKPLTDMLRKDEIIFLKNSRH